MVRVRSFVRNVGELRLRRRVRVRAFAFLYGRGARWYDPFTDWLFLGEWAAWQQTALPFLPPSGLIVELGCGTGRLAIAGHTRERSWLGVDLSPAMLAVARRRLVPGGPAFVRADARRLPLADGTAAAVVATFPTAYILNPAVAAELRRILNRGARVVIVMSGELAVDTVRRRLRWWAMRIFYGRRGQQARMDLTLPGFDGNRHGVRSPHGEADVYVFLPTGRRAEDCRSGANPVGDAPNRALTKECRLPPPARSDSGPRGG